MEGVGLKFGEVAGVGEMKIRCMGLSKLHSSGCVNVESGVLK